MLCNIKLLIFLFKIQLKPDFLIQNILLQFKHKHAHNLIAVYFLMKNQFYKLQR